jgi:cytoskeletal protein CcmA (bactofilin family)
MFGKRKAANTPDAPGAAKAPEAAALPGAETSQQQAQTAPQASAAKPAMSAVGTGVAAAPSKNQGRRQEGRLPSAVEGRKLVVGREICLSGEIKTCEKLVVEGKVEADLSDSHVLEVTEPGLYKGNATVEDCEISGTFEGDLTVTGTLVIHPSGKVSGKIRYAEMIMHRGAQLRGDIDVLDPAALRRARGEGLKLAHSTSADDKTQAS